MDYATPIAWKAGQPFGIVAECSLRDLAYLSQAFIEGTVMMDDMLQLQSMTSQSACVTHTHGLPSALSPCFCKVQNAKECATARDSVYLYN